MRWLAIANPAAGNPRQVRRAVEALGQVAGLRHEVVATEAPGDAARIARQSGDFDAVIAVGGDGTICEVLNGMALDRQLLAVLPAGHGNCLARDLGCWTLPQALEALRCPRPASLDVLDARLGFGDGRERRLLCASTIAAGYVAQVVTFGRQRMASLGVAAYAGAAMLTRPVHFDLRFDGEDRLQRRTGIVVNNTAHLSNFRGLPDASVRDGLLDVMELDAAWPRQLLHNLAVLAGSRRFGPRALRQAPAVRFDFREPCTLMADGELLQAVARVDVDCRAAAVRCLAGAM